MRIAHPALLAVALVLALVARASARDPRPTLMDLTLDTLATMAGRPAGGQFFANPLPRGSTDEKIYAYEGLLLLVSTSARTPIDETSLQRAAADKSGVEVRGTFQFDARSKLFTFDVTERGEYYSESDTERLALELARFLYRNPHLEVVLADKAQRKDFREYLAKEKKAHLVEFLDDVDEFIGKPSMPGWERLWSTYLDARASKSLDLHESSRKTMEDLRADIRKRQPSLSTDWALARVKGVRHEIWDKVSDVHRRWASDAAVDEAKRAHIRVAGLDPAAKKD